MGIPGGIGKARLWGICLNRVPALGGWWGGTDEQNWCQKNCSAKPYLLVHSSKMSGAGMNALFFLQMGNTGINYCQNLSTI